MYIFNNISTQYFNFIFPATPENALPKTATNSQHYRSPHKSVSYKSYELNVKKTSPVKTSTIKAKKYLSGSCFIILYFIIY